MDIQIDVYIYIYMYISICICIYVYVYLYNYISIHIIIYIYISIHLSTVSIHWLECTLEKRSGKYFWGLFWLESISIRGYASSLQCSMFFREYIRLLFCWDSDLTHRWIAKQTSRYTTDVDSAKYFRYNPKGDG